MRRFAGDDQTQYRPFVQGARGRTLFVPPSTGEGPHVEGRDAFRQLVLSLRQGFPDVRFQVHDVTANDDTVIVAWTMTGTHAAGWQGIPPTGRHVSLPGVDIFKIAAGKIVQERIQRRLSRLSPTTRCDSTVKIPPASRGPAHPAP